MEDKDVVPQDPHDAWLAARAAERKAEKARKLKEWKAAHPDKVRSYWDSPKGREQRDAYYHSEHGRALRKAREIKNAEKRRERQRAYNQSEKGKRVAREYKDSYLSSPPRRIHHSLLAVRTRARLAGMEFEDALFGHLEAQPPKNCPCCGIEITYHIKKRACTTPSIDRVDNSMGYVVGNAFVVCGACNMLKNDGTIADFENILAYMKARIPVQRGVLHENAGQSQWHQRKRKWIPTPEQMKALSDGQKRRWAKWREAKTALEAERQAIKLLAQRSAYPPPSPSKPRGEASL